MLDSRKPGAMERQLVRGAQGQSGETGAARIQVCYSHWAPEYVEAGVTLNTDLTTQTPTPAEQQYPTHTCMNEETASTILFLKGLQSTRKKLEKRHTYVNLAPVSVFQLPSSQLLSLQGVTVVSWQTQLCSGSHQHHLRLPHSDIMLCPLITSLYQHLLPNLICSLKSL